MRLRRRFALVLVVVAVVLSVTTLVGFTLYRDAVVTQERADLVRTSESVATQLEIVLSEKRRTVELWSETDGLAAHRTAAQDAALSTLVRRTSFSGASVIAANGTMTGISSLGLNDTAEQGLVGQRFADRTYFQRALLGETYVSDPVDAASGFLIVTISTPVRRDGETVGTLNAAFHVREGDLAGVVRTSSSETQGISVYAGEMTVFTQGPLPRAEGTDVVANASIPSTEWTVSATSTREAAESRLLSVSALQIGALLLVLVSLAGFGWWMYREYVDNVERLQDGFTALSDGDYDTRIALSGAAEWDRLGTQFNDLSETLAQRHAEVTVLNRVLRHNLRNAMTVVLSSTDRIAAATDDEALADDAARIRRRAESLLGLADHARALESTLEDHADADAVRPVADVVDDVVTVHAEEFPTASVSAETDGLDGAAVDHGDLLVVALNELVRNGIIHDDGDPAVTLTATATDDEVTVTVADDGPGLPPVERRILTDSFVETPIQHGSGLGLWLVTWLLSRIDGTLDVSVGDGTRVTVTVPRAGDATDDADADGEARVDGDP